MTMTEEGCAKKETAKPLRLFWFEGNSGIDAYAEPPVVGGFYRVQINLRLLPVKIVGIDAYRGRICVQESPYCEARMIDEVEGIRRIFYDNPSSVDSKNIIIPLAVKRLTDEEVNSLSKRYKEAAEKEYREKLKQVDSFFDMRKEDLALIVKRLSRQSPNNSFSGDHTGGLDERDYDPESD